jgi:hypothetical protein
MRSAVKQRLDLAKDMLERPWFRGVLLLWGAIGIWDTALSQLVPDKISKDAPRVYQIAIWLLNMTGGWLPFWGWLLIGASLLVVGTLEFAFRTSHEERIRQRYLQPKGALEKGFLDFQVDGLQAMDDLNNTINITSKDTMRFANGLGKYGSKIRRAKKPQRQRRYASAAAKFINAYSERLQKAADFIGSVAPVVAENQIGVIEREMNVASLQTYADTVCQTADVIMPATLKSLEEMQQSTGLIRGISADLNASGSRLEQVLGSYIEKTKNFGVVCKQLQAAALDRIAMLNTT